MDLQEKLAVLMSYAADDREGVPSSAPSIRSEPASKYSRVRSAAGPVARVVRLRPVNRPAGIAASSF